MIVISVLLALAGDAWWAGVQERRIERAYLQQLKADLVQIDEAVGDWLELEQQHIGSAVRLLEYVAAQEPTAPTDSVQTWWIQTWSSPTRPLSDGTLREMLSSGSMRVIEDDSLRTLLSTFARSIDDTQEALTQIESNFSLLIADPYFQENVGLWGMYSESVKNQRGIPPGARFAVNFERIRHDRAFGNLIMRGYVYKLNRVGQISRLKEAAMELRSSLEAKS